MSETERDCLRYAQGMYLLHELRTVHRIQKAWEKGQRALVGRRRCCTWAILRMR